MEEKLIEQGVKHVIVSMAGEGALLFTAEGIYEATVPKGVVINSVGAGGFSCCRVCRQI